ncbi:MAG: hypothetical protein MUO26_12655 [Methanotrichaceae archaeon]|nr:hypothetical protein [Methanotrichaceae archaeon]
MRYFRKLQNINPSKGRFLTVSIPADLSGIFSATDVAIIEPLEGQKGIAIKPARVEALL